MLGCALIAALGGLLFGFDTAVISGTTDALRTKFALSDNLLGRRLAPSGDQSRGIVLRLQQTGDPHPKPSGRSSHLLRTGEADREARLGDRLLTIWG